MMHWQQKYGSPLMRCSTAGSILTLGGLHRQHTNHLWYASVITLQTNSILCAAADSRLPLKVAVQRALQSCS